MNPQLLAWAHVLSDFLIGWSYVSISITLLYLYRRAHGALPYDHVLLAFGTFIIACGFTHFGHMWLTVQNSFWFLGLAQLVTVVASVATALLFPRIVPRILRLLHSARAAEEAKIRELREHEGRVAAERLAATRQDLLAMVSHELKNPLAAIKGLGELLGRQVQRGAQRPERLAQHSAQLQAAVSRMELLLNDLMDAARLQGGALTLLRTEFDLVQLAATVAERAEHNAFKRPTHRLVLDAVEPVVGRWDRQRIDQILTNLLSNAFKYSPQGGEVRIRIRPAADGATVAVSDQGIGIGADERQALFTPFERGDAALRANASGDGLGLYITYSLVRAHGGRIAVASAVGEGSTFTVTLPATAGREGASDLAASPQLYTGGPQPVG